MNISVIAMMLVALLAGAACSKKEAGPSQMGVGPIQEKVALAAISPELAAAGQKHFQEKCSACHKMTEKYVGPALQGVTQRRSPEWIMNMILNPEEMTKQDPVARELLASYYTQMTFQNVSKEDARAILEYFRQNDAGGLP